jgi:hypothetical protein
MGRTHTVAAQLLLLLLVVVVAMSPGLDILSHWQHDLQSLNLLDCR